MALKSILEILQDHEPKVELTSDYLDQTHRKMLSDSLTMAKRIINNSGVISFVSYFDALETICSRRFDKAYSRYATNFDLKYEDKSVCYVIFQKAYPKLPEDRASVKYDELLNNCVYEHEGELALNQRKFESKYVSRWLARMRPEQKIYIVSACNSDDLIDRFDLQVLRESSHDLIELATHTMMAAAFVVGLINEFDTHPQETLHELAKKHANLIYQLAFPVNSILANTGSAALTKEDIPNLDKAIKDASMANARSNRKTVTVSVRNEWREFAYKNWPSLAKPNNQVGNMAKLIHSTLESAKEFKLDTVHDNIKGIKTKALSQK